MFFWKTEPPVASETNPEFSSQSEAETWLAENYQDLEALEVDAVTLFEDDHVVYGPMRLDEN